MMHRQLIAILLLFAFSAQVFNRALIMADYYANKAEFAKNCENKSKPVMHCNGKCQVMKKIREEEKKEKQNPERKTENNQELVVTQSIITPIVTNELYTAQSYSLFCPDFLASGIKTGIFHPPSIA